MALHLLQASMPITEKITHDSSMNLSGKGFLMIQHGVSDALHVCQMIQQNCRPDELIFLPKPYSQNPHDLRDAQEAGLHIINPGVDYSSGLEKSGFLEKVIGDMKSDKIVVVEVGGCFSGPLQRSQELRERILGITEVTTFGHNRHLQVHTNEYTPIFSIARSPIKDGEAKHVGLSVYRAIDQTLHDLNRAIVDTQVLMVGYGMIGRNTCEAFRGCKTVSAFDTDEESRKMAKEKGFITSGKYQELTEQADIVIASTGGRSVNGEFIKSCRDGVLLVSAGSRQNEIDVDFLENSSGIKPRKIHKNITHYTINGKNIFLFREGKNANFATKSCPASSMDLIHAEVLTCTRNILTGKYMLGAGINETSHEEQEMLLSQHKEIWA